MAHALQTALGPLAEHKGTKLSGRECAEADYE